MRVGVLTGGGDCPGLNAVIRSVTKSLIHLCDAQVVGIKDGFAGLLEQRTQMLDWNSVRGILSSGGTILGASNRANPLASKDSLALALENYRALALDALIAIGGDGTMTIAQALAQHGLRVVGVPKTIDNDIEGCERRNQITSIALNHVSGRNRRIPADHPLLATARQIGIQLGH